MSLSINTNVSALTAQRNLGINSMDSATSLSKLSSGSRIPSAKFDAAGLAVGTKLNAEVESLRTASQNASQATSMLQIADGALGTVSDVLTRMKSLAVQSSSGQLADSERSLLNQEFVQLRSEIDRIAQDTDFNGTQLLNGGDIEANATFASAGNLANNGVTLNFDANQTGDGDAYRISYDYADNTTDGDSTDQQDTGNLTVTNLTTGQSETINIREAVQAVTGEALDTTGEGAVGDDVFTTDLGAGETATINFANTGVQVTLDSNFDVDGTQYTTTFSTGNGNLGTTFAGATAVNAAVTSAVSNVNVPDGTGGVAALDTAGLSDLQELGATVFDQSTGDLFINIDEDASNGDYTVAATAGLEFSIDGGSTFVAGDDASLTDIAEAATTNIQVRLDGSGTNGSNAVIGSFTIGAHTQAVDNTDSTLGIRIGDGIFGVDETAGTTASFSYKVGTGTDNAADDISITLGSASTSALGIAGESVDSVANSESAINALDQAINTVSSRRADVGASQSRLDFAAASVNVAIENTTAARSGIMDADISQEMTEFTSKQVLVQAGVSMLAQANQQPSLLLRLLQ